MARGGGLGLADMKVCFINDYKKYFDECGILFFLGEKNLCKTKGLLLPRIDIFSCIIYDEGSPKSSRGPSRRPYIIEKPEPYLFWSFNLLILFFSPKQNN